jgi:hypothetical protein
MPNKSDVKKLSRCVRDANGDPAKLKACEDAFKADGGSVIDPGDGGKVFSDVNGGKVFVTNGGKVF